MSDKRAKWQGQSRPKSRMQALGDILYANEQKSQNAFLFLYGGSIIRLIKTYLYVHSKLFININIAIIFYKFD